jgi:hypothetical protein
MLVELVPALVGSFKAGIKDSCALRRIPDNLEPH